MDQQPATSHGIACNIKAADLEATGPRLSLASLRLLDEEYADYVPPPTWQILAVARAERLGRGTTRPPGLRLREAPMSNTGESHDEAPQTP